VKKLNMKFKTGIASLAVGVGLVADASMAQNAANDPELLQFLRGAHAEACTRKILNGTAEEVKANVNRSRDANFVKSASRLLELNFIWKMTPKELESVFGGLYVHGAYFCECALRAVTDVDLVRPVGGLELLNTLPESTLDACYTLASRRAERYEKDASREKR